MDCFSVSLEVPFSLGENAEFNHDPVSWVDGVKPFKQIDLVLFQLPIPDFTTTDGIYFAKPKLANELKSLSGLLECDYTLAFDEQMEELGKFKGKNIPELACFEVVGKYGTDDFSHVDGEPDLVVSERALAVLRQFDLGELAEIKPFNA